MELQPHPELRHHAEHLDFMLYQTQKDLDATRAYANQTHAHITEQGEAIKLLNNDRKSLRQQRAKKDTTIRRLRARIASLEATVKAQEDQIRQLEDDDGGIDIRRDAFLSDDNDFEEDENTEEEDYGFWRQDRRLHDPSQSHQRRDVATLRKPYLPTGKQKEPNAKPTSSLCRTSPTKAMEIMITLDPSSRTSRTPTLRCLARPRNPSTPDDWLQTMENNLEVARVEANEKVLFATHYLAGPARAWWTSTRAMNGGQFMTWEDFKLKFSKYHVPPGLIKKMRMSSVN
ncbi:hypothetical protein QYE76_065591 [Lolium multiflorum]|uniref:Retrotransposon gag domain-containing protein n=1 Tax=Lolium multiflorum TaxID=4521 RepID=A0AAD8SAE0_LOLMU|nr:hypothetical protein QYE76_065591 [Lolium multiflorum]